MKNQYKKNIIYVSSILIIYIIIYFFVTPTLQYKKYRNSNKDAFSFKNTKILKTQSLEKITILIDNLDFNINKLEREPVDKNLHTLENSIKITENYILESKYIFMYPNTYEILSNAYLAKHNYTKNKDDIIASYKYANKLLNYAENKSAFQYRVNLSKIDIGNIDEGVKKIEEIYKKNYTEVIDSYYLGLAKYYGGDKSESLKNLEIVFNNTESKKFIRSKQELINIYYDFMKYFYIKKDYAEFLSSVKRLHTLDFSNKEFFEYIISNTDNKTAPYLELKY